jgi:uncharacterized OB-fold protein
LALTSPSSEIPPQGGYPWDVPEYNKIARFLSSLKESKIETTKCNKCSAVQWPPRSICAKCLSLDLSWTELPKRGTLTTYSKAYIGTVQGEEIPMIVAAVHLENGLRLLTRIVDAKYEDLAVGMPVKLVKASLVNGKPYWEFSPVKLRQ